MLGKVGRLDPGSYTIVSTGWFCYPLTENACKRRANRKKEVFTWTPAGTGYPGDAGAVSQQHPFGPGPRLHLLPEQWIVPTKKTQMQLTEHFQTVKWKIPLRSPIFCTLYQLHSNSHQSFHLVLGFLLQFQHVFHLDHGRLLLSRGIPTHAGQTTSEMSTFVCAC